MADTYIKISELEETTLADDSSYIPIDNGNHTYKISVENYNSGANATAQSYAEAAAASADAAETAKTAAETAETETGLIRTATQQYATAASGSASAAASSAVDALNYADSAASAAANAADSAQDAAESYTNAAEKAVLSESWAVGGTNTRTGEDTNNSQYYAAVATSAAENAEDQVELANAASTAASGSAVDAAASATEASGYADDASDYATAASGSATAAATSATQSANSAGAAATSATNAAASATAASGSASTATTQANNAAQSATTAGGYATQAASSASDASGYATNAANSATAAAGSATTASNQATAAAGSATAAAASASDAADSAADAAESAATFTTDDTLSIAGKAADAKAAGDMIAAVQAEIPELDNWLTTPGAAAEAKHTGDRITEVEDDVADLKSDYNFIGTKVNPCIIDESTDFLNGYLNTSDGSFVPTSNTQWTTDFVEVEQGVTYNCDCSVASGGTTQTYPRAICLYKSDKSFSRNLTLPAGIPFTVASNEYYIRLNYNGTLNSLAVYPASVGKESYYQLKGTTRLPADYVANVDKRIELAKFNYVHARRPIISFILDGDYDLNPTMEAIFASHGYRIGFAPQYKTFYYLPTNQAVLDKYLAWQSKGHEILAHLQYILNDQTTYTDAEAKQIIKDSYTIMTGVGLNVKGAIGSSGKVADRFVPTIQKYYDYSATELNHGGTPTATLPAVLSFLDDNPYHLWRYSLQNSSPQQMQDAVDTCIADNGLLMFYGHAQSTNTDYFTAENLETLLTYIDGKVSNLDCTVQTPYDAIRDFYSIRYDDVIPSN